MEIIPQSGETAVAGQPDPDPFVERWNRIGGKIRITTTVEHSSEFFLEWLRQNFADRYTNFGAGNNTEDFEPNGNGFQVQWSRPRIGLTETPIAVQCKHPIYSDPFKQWEHVDDVKKCDEFLARLAAKFPETREHLFDAIKDADYAALLPKLTKKAVEYTAVAGRQSITVGLNTKPPGRRPDRDNTEAYQKLIDEGEQLAFDFWCKSKGIDNPKTKDRQNFKQSMERAAKRTNS